MHQILYNTWCIASFRRQNILIITFGEICQHRIIPILETINVIYVNNWRILIGLFTQWSALSFSDFRRLAFTHLNYESFATIIQNGIGQHIVWFLSSRMKTSQMYLSNISNLNVVSMQWHFFVIKLCLTCAPSSLKQTISVPPYDHHDVSNHRQFDCLCNSSDYHQCEYQSSTLVVLRNGNGPVDSWKRISNV